MSEFDLKEVIVNQAVKIQRLNNMVDYLREQLLSKKDTTVQADE